jgi:hypothetical protein
MLKRRFVSQWSFCDQGGEGVDEKLGYRLFRGELISHNNQDDRQ